jgi:hypothetical protein
MPFSVCVGVLDGVGLARSFPYRGLRCQSCAACSTHPFQYQTVDGGLDVFPQGTILLLLPRQLNVLLSQPY